MTGRNTVPPQGGTPLPGENPQTQDRLKQAINMLLSQKVINNRPGYTPKGEPLLMTRQAPPAITRDNTDAVYWQGMQSTRFDWPQLDIVTEVNNMDMNKSLGLRYDDDDPNATRKRRLVYHNSVATLSERRAADFFAGWVARILNPAPTNVDLVEAAIIVLYQALGTLPAKTLPEIRWFENPVDALKAVGNIVTPRVLIDNLPNGSDFNNNVRTYYNAVNTALQSNKAINFQPAHCLTPHTITRLILFDMSATFGLPVPDKYRALMALVANTGLVIPTEKVCYVSKAPVAVRFDDRGRLHHESRPAIEYPDGTGFCYWHNVMVPSHVIVNPASITLTEIDSETNQEVKRVMIEQYGASRYLIDTGAKEVASNEYGTILVRDMGRWEEPIVVVKVRNSTPEGLWVNTGQFDEIATVDAHGNQHVLRKPIMQFVPQLDQDGKPYHKYYYLRVDPNAYGGAAARDPQAAVASTWRDDQGRMLFSDYRQYKPDFES